ncbi:hypothetical protein J3Q64DRAFT_1723702 [Phycomyces blakesleeanus]|uniref:RanBD1 domain-containing protein n=1 Tax=Phycomyces blakesleeanus TaxID=4837 RepID=A0ABR3B9J3_PHYBL
MRQHPRPSGSGRTSSNEPSGPGRHSNNSPVPTHSNSRNLRPNASPSAPHSRSSSHSSRGPSDQQSSSRQPPHHQSGQRSHPQPQSQPHPQQSRSSGQRTSNGQPQYRPQYQPQQRPRPQQQQQQQHQQQHQHQQQQTRQYQPQQPRPQQSRQPHLQQQHGHDPHGNRGRSPSPNPHAQANRHHGNMQRPDGVNHQMRSATASGSGQNQANNQHLVPGQQQQQQQQESDSSRPRQTQPSPRLTPQSVEETDSPPRSPNPNTGGPAAGIRAVLYHNEQSEVFRWKDETWYAVEGHCELEVRQTVTNRSCVAIRLQETGELYLNAWILPSTMMNQISETDVSLSVFMGANQENYLIHFEDTSDATALIEVLQRTHRETIAMAEQARASSPQDSPDIGRSDSLASITAPNGAADGKPEENLVPQTLQSAMQCKCKLFVQNEHSKWSSFGNVNMTISQQLPSKKMYIEIESEKGSKTTKLVSASVHSRNVEKINAKRISFLLVNEKESISMVYMVKVKEEQIGNSIIDYLKTKNAENGW